MSMISAPISHQASLGNEVQQLASLLSAIFRECNIDAQALINELKQLTTSESSDSQTSALWESPAVHLACTQVVFEWRRDREFLDPQGNPRPLEKCGSTGSFERLCTQFAPGHVPEKLLQYLVSLGAVKQADDSTLHLLTESVLACATDPQPAIASGTVLMHLRGFLGTVKFNLSRRGGDLPPRFERACYGEIPTKLVPVFQQLVASRGQNFIDSIDEWLDRHRATSGTEAQVSRVGAGAYMLLHNSIRIE